MVQSVQKNYIDNILDVIQNSIIHLRMVGLNQFVCARHAEDIV